MVLSIKEFIFKIGNHQVVESLFSDKMICELLESHNFYKFGSKR